MPSLPALHVLKEAGLFSTRIEPSSCGRWSTAPRGSLAGTVASGRLRWPRRLPLRRDSLKGGSQGRPSGLLWRAFLECVGSEPNAGSPPPIPCTREKRRRDRLMEVAAADPEWAVGFEDECWWSRVALPTLSSWSEQGKPIRLVQRSVAKDDPDPKAISCYGLYMPELEQTWLRFVDGRPVSGVTTRFLQWSCEKLEAVGKKVLLLIWDNASWHISKEVRRWLGSHNRFVKRSGEGVRIVSCLLPKQSPWLNAIEPKWIHGKRKVVEPEGLLGAYELAERVCRVFGCPHYEHLSIPREVA